MKRRAFLYACVTLSILIFGALAAPSTYAEEKGKAQTMCPIMGGPINKSAHLDFEGNRVYFCCDGCKAEFLKDPKKYVNKMESEGIVLETAPVGEKGPGHHEQDRQGGEKHGSGCDGCGHDGCKHHGCKHHECGSHS